MSPIELAFRPLRISVALGFAALLLATSCSQQRLRNAADTPDVGTNSDVSAGGPSGFFTGQVQQGTVPSDGTNPDAPKIVVVVSWDPELNAGDPLRVDLGFSDAQGDLATVNFGISGQPTYNTLSVGSVGTQTSGTLTLDFTPQSYDPGDYTLVISITDQAGHTSASATVNFTILNPAGTVPGDSDAAVPADAPVASGPADGGVARDLGGTGVPDSGVPARPTIVASVATVTVGAVDIGKTTSAATVTIANNGNVGGVLTVTPAGLGIAATGCTGTLAAGQSCILSITASPVSVGPIVGSVSVSIANGNTLTIGVTGTSGPGPGGMVLSPSQFSLGDVPVGAIIQLSVTVTAQSALTGLVVGVQGADLKLDATTTCTSVLAAGNTCAVVVNFASATAGSPTSDAVVVSQGGVTKSVPVTANVLAAAKLAATPLAATLTAGPGTSGSPLDINVANVGGMTTGQLGVSLGGTDSADFKIVSDTCSIVTLPGGKFCTITVTYSPASTVTAAEKATLTITDNGVGASAVSVALSGTPSLTTSLTITGGPALGSVAPGTSGAEVLFTVTNTSATPSGALTASVNNANIIISSNACATSATLGLNESCTLGLKLAPSAIATPQAIAALLTVTDVIGGKVSAPVTGSIVSSAPLSATPGSINFGVVSVGQTSTIQTITIRNVSATATGPLSVTLSGTGAAQLALTANTCTGPLAPAATCTVGVRFSPIDTNGVNGSVTISDGIAADVIPVVGSGM